MNHVLVTADMIARYHSLMSVSGGISDAIARFAERGERRENIDETAPYT